MRAIVLSCDRYAPMAAHMVRTYRRVWPDHPFVFRIPFQEIEWPAEWRDPAIELGDGTNSIAGSHHSSGQRRSWTGIRKTNG